MLDILRNLVVSQVEDSGADVAGVIDLVVAASPTSQGGTGTVQAMLLASTATKFLIDLLRSVGPAIVNDSRVIRISTLVLGAVYALLTYFVAGYPWPDALLMFLSGPGAIVVNTIGNTLKKKKGTEDETCPPKSPSKAPKKPRSPR